MLRIYSVAALLLVSACGHNGIVGQACMKSDRNAATAQTCSCVQNAADQTLSRKEQRQAAKLFRKPARAHDRRFSDDPDDRAFWQRYKRFVTMSTRSCSRS